MLKRSIKSFAAAVAVALCASTGAQAANIFVAPDGRVMSVADVREINLVADGFQLSYGDGNVSDVFSDPGYALLTKVLTAPALANMARVGNTGRYIHTDHIKKSQCQAGGGIPEAPAATGNYALIYWAKSGYALITDPGCTFYAGLKAGSIK